MATINRFQQYSQKENTVTNNVLFMFSCLYEIRPSYYEEMINSLLDESNYESLPNFHNQVGNEGDGVIDGMIEFKPSKIIIETKLKGTDSIKKLVKYAKSFNENSTNILIHLSRDAFSDEKVNEIVGLLKENFQDKKTVFHSITYQGLVDQLTDLKHNYPYEAELARLCDQFEEYCKNSNLMPKSNHILRAMACGQSWQLNEKHQFYFDMAHRGYSHFNYFGIYFRKAVRFVAKVENMIVADWSEEDGLIVKTSESVVTSEQKSRLIAAIKESLDEGWSIKVDHRFFLLKDFQATKFRKTSPGGIFRVRYFNLEKEFENVPKSMDILAEELAKHTWK